MSIEYPSQFSAGARAALVAARVRAKNAHRERGRDPEWQSREEESLRECILEIFEVYAAEVIELGSHGVWSIDKLGEYALEGLRRITIDFCYEITGGSRFLEYGSGSLSTKARLAFQNSKQWLQFEDQLLGLAGGKRIPDGTRQFDSTAAASHQGMNLTPGQWDLLRILASNPKENKGAEFFLVRHNSSCSLVYSSGVSIPITHDDSDLDQLRSERLISFGRLAPDRAKGKITQQGIMLAQEKNLSGHHGRNEVDTSTQLEIAEDVGEHNVSDKLSEIIIHRNQMLSEYKAATGNPSNRSIYTAKNSGIHKPEFYDWLKGKLAPHSSTCVTFERFLAEKRPPLPRPT